MAQAPYEIIAAPANVWVAALATAFPEIDDAPGAGWFPMGYTDGGVTVTHNQDIEELYVDQVQAPIKRRRTTESVTVEFSVAQLTIERYAKVLGKTAPAPSGTPAVVAIDLDMGPDITPFCMLVRGPSPYGEWNMQYELYSVSQSENPSVSYNREGLSSLSTSWAGNADITRTAGQQVGRLLAQQSA